MVTLKLKKSPPPPETGSERRPARGSSAPRRRPTLAEAQAARAEAAERREEWEGRPAPAPTAARTDRPIGRGTDRRSAPRPERPQDRPQDRCFEREDRPERRADRPAERRDERRDDAWADRRPPRAEAPRGEGGSDPRRAAAPRPRPQERDGGDRRPARGEGARPDGPTRRPAAVGNPVGAGPQTRRPPPAPQGAAAAATPPTAADGERLSKRMTALGLASRREADEWIEAGWVKVDGRMAVLGQRVGPQARIEIDPAAQQQQAQRVTVLLHKPIGYVSGQAEDGYEPAVVLVRPENQWAEDRSGLRWHPGHLRHLAPAGRLDIDSTGLLVLTQDGRVARQLIGDDSDVEKEYLVRVRYTRAAPGQPQLPAADLALLNHGLELDGQRLRPAKVSWANEDQLRFVLREGRKRQIRRMCEAVGLEVLALKRVRIGSVPLGHLPPGQWRFLRRDEFFA